MSLYSVDPGIKKLQKELAEKESRFNRLNDDSKFDALFLVSESESNLQGFAGPVWRDLHLKRAALVGVSY